MDNDTVGLREMIQFAHRVGRCDCNDPTGTPADQCVSLIVEAKALRKEEHPGLGRRLLNRLGH